MSTGDFAVAALALSAAGEQISENLFGPFLHAHFMRLASIGVGVGLAFGLREMGFLDLGGLTTWQTVTLGGISGLGSNVVHALWEKVAPGSGNAPVAGILNKLAGKED